MDHAFALLSVLFLAILFATSPLCGQSLTIPQTEFINGEISWSLKHLRNGDFRSAGTINYGKKSTEVERKNATRSWNYTYEYKTISGISIFGSVYKLDSSIFKEYVFTIPTTESGLELTIFHRGAHYHTITFKEEPGEIIWKETEPGVFQFTFDPKDHRQARVVWDQGQEEESWGKERLQSDGTFTVQPDHLLKSDVIVLVEAQRGMRFKRKYLRPGVGEIPRPAWLD